MKLTYPQTQTDWEWWRNKKFPGIPNQYGIGSEYQMIGCAESGYDVYVAFTNKEHTEIWIEKTSILLGRKMLAIEDLVQIKTDEEFNVAHEFFTKRGILDGKESTK